MTRFPMEAREELTGRERGEGRGGGVLVEGGRLTITGVLGFVQVSKPLSPLYSITSALCAHLAPVLMETQSKTPSILYILKAQELIFFSVPSSKFRADIPEVPGCSPVIVCARRGNEASARVWSCPFLP